MMGDGVAATASQDPMSPRLLQAIREAATWHEGQKRRGSDVPYVEHVIAVAWILDRLGFSEDVVIAGLLHDTVEDTAATLDDIAARFGKGVADLVAHCSEVKFDEAGRKRPWIDRKRDHIAAIAKSPAEARAVILADKLHNLRCIATDLREGRPIWSLFHAPREQVLWYYHSLVAACRSDETRVETLARRCRAAIEEVEGLG